MDVDLPDLICLKCTGRGRVRPSLTEVRLPQVALLEMHMQRDSPVVEQISPMQPDIKGVQVKPGKGRAQMRKERREKCFSQLENSIPSLNSSNMCENSFQTSNATVDDDHTCKSGLKDVREISLNTSPVQWKTTKKMNMCCPAEADSEECFIPTGCQSQKVEAYHYMNISGENNIENGNKLI